MFTDIPGVTSSTNKMYAKRGTESTKNLLTGSISYTNRDEPHLNVTPKKSAMLREIENRPETFTTAANAIKVDLPSLTKQNSNEDLRTLSNPFEKEIFTKFSPL